MTIIGIYIAIAVVYLIGAYLTEIGYDDAYITYGQTIMFYALIVSNIFTLSTYLKEKSDIHEKQTFLKEV